MTPAHLSDMLIRINLNKAGAARLLHIQRGTLDRYLSGKEPIPRKIELACIALEHCTHEQLQKYQK